jgi:predicted RNA-binding protein
MCELKVILVDGDSREEVMESVTKLVVDGDSVTVYGIFGESTTVKGSVKEINFGTGEAILHK